MLLSQYSFGAIVSLNSVNNLCFILGSMTENFGSLEISLQCSFIIDGL